MGKYHSELLMLFNLAYLMKCKYCGSKSVRPASGGLGERILAATDLTRYFKTSIESSTAKRSALGMSATGPLR